MKTAQPKALSQAESVPTLSDEQLKKLHAIKTKVAEIVRKMDGYPEPVVRSKNLVETA